jgi:hypothetical protein
MKKKATPQTGTVELDLYESGILCNVLIRAIMESPGGFEAAPLPIQNLCSKLTDLNDKLMGKK